MQEFENTDVGQEVEQVIEAVEAEHPEQEAQDDGAYNLEDDAGTDKPKEREPWPKTAENAFNRVKKERNELKEKYRALRQQYEEMKRNFQQFKEPDAPTEDQYEKYTDYLDARAQHKAEQTYMSKQKEQYEQGMQRLEAESERVWLEERTSAFDENLNHLKQVASDYAQVEAYAEPIIANFDVNLRKAILSIDNAPKALYNLAKEGRLENLSYMPFEMAVAEIVQAQYRGDFQAGQARPQMNAQPKTVTSAPKPLKTVSGTGKPTKALHEMSEEEVWAQFQ